MGVHMVKKVSIKQPTVLLENLWRTSTPSQKKALLKARGLSLTWAKTKTIREMVDQGGGLIARDLLNLVRKWGSRTTKKEVIFRK